jgi:hypothetical protein
VKLRGGFRRAAAGKILRSLHAVSQQLQRIQEYFNAPLPEVALLGQFESLGLIGKSKPFIELLRLEPPAAAMCACC